MLNLKRKKIIHLQPFSLWSFNTSRAQFLDIVIKGSHFSFQHCNVALDFYDFFIRVARCLLIVLLTFRQLVFHLTNIIGYLFEPVRRNGSFRAWLSPDTVDFYSKVINFFRVLIGFFRIFDDFSIETVGQFNNRLFGLRLEFLYFFIELVIILGILSFILLSKPFHFKNDRSELFNLFFTFLTFIIFVIPHLAIQNFLIVLNTWFKHFKILIGVLLKFVDFESELIGFLEDNSLNEFLLLLDLCLHIVVKIVHLLVNLSF